ncbi:alpha/beta hydrolase [Viridibacterium curvum]|uniref:Alpha/beta hydrolase n=1 Tax=Viridibacterium curvum TaxID=1101404 RepID=A0ABP9QJU7_9RHOO
MGRLLKFWLVMVTALWATLAGAQLDQRVVDIPTRPGVSQRLLVLTPTAPRAVAILFAGGHGGLQLTAEGAFRWGEGNFLIRSRKLFVEQGFVVVVVDAPSDRQSPPFLSGYRQRPDHVADVKTVIAWVRAQARLPVWLVGTSRGTQSVAWVASELSGSDAPDGLLLSATILTDKGGHPVPAMPLAALRMPVLVVHHERDECMHCAFSEVPALMDKLVAVPRKKLLSFTRGVSRGDPCEAFAYHGFNGIERDVVAQAAAWILGE